MDPTTVAAQQAAMLKVRARFERGEVAYDDFRRGFDALLLAQDPTECEAILRELPVTALAPLNALDRAAVTKVEPEPARIVAFMGETRKMRRTWRLVPSTQITAVMGEVRLDLTRAELPARASIQVTAVMGTVILYVPSAARVVVRARAYLGEVNLLGERAGGVVASGHEVHAPSSEPASADLEIEVLAVMATVKVTLADGPVTPLGDLVRDTLRLAAESFRRGLHDARRPASPADPTAASQPRTHLAHPAVDAHANDAR